jgi:hypothetical protein
MDYNNVEIGAGKEMIELTPGVVELSDLELALVGGGCGEVTPY